MLMAVQLLQHPGNGVIPPLTAARTSSGKRLEGLRRRRPQVRILSGALENDEAPRRLGYPLVKKAVLFPLLPQVLAGDAQDLC